MAFQRSWVLRLVLLAFSASFLSTSSVVFGSATVNANGNDTVSNDGNDTVFNDGDNNPFVVFPSNATLPQNSTVPCICPESEEQGEDGKGTNKDEISAQLAAPKPNGTTTTKIYFNFFSFSRCSKDYYSMLYLRWALVFVSFILFACLLSNFLFAEREAKKDAYIVNHL